MTNEEILKIAKSCGFDNFQKRKFDGGNDYGTQWGCWEDQLLKFARTIRTCGWDESYEYATEIHKDEINLLREELKKLEKVND